MKRLSLILLLVLLFGCHYPKSSTSQKQATSEVELELGQAVANKDFRLYVTSGRRFTLPGVIKSEKESLISQCGRKFMFGTGDVFKSKQQRTERKQKIAYMTQYNQLMIKYCQK